MLLLALGECDLQFGAAFAPVEGQRYQGVALAVDQSDQSIQLTAVQQQFTAAQWVGVDMGRCSG